eukprot:4573917-Pleurochrysis_carterae.AAC.1
MYFAKGRTPKFNDDTSEEEGELDSAADHADRQVSDDGNALPLAPSKRRQCPAASPTPAAAQLAGS